MKTHVLMITDESGSMQLVHQDVIGGQRSYLAKLAEDPDVENYTITQFTFDTTVRQIDLRVPVAHATRFDSGVYYPKGMTALLDAIGNTVRSFNALPREEDDRVVLFIQTDGAENSSREWSAASVRELLAECERKGWAVIYSGVGPAGWAGREDLGRGHASTHSARDSRGTQALYDSYAGATRAAHSSTRTLNSTEVSGLVQKGLDEAVGEQGA